MFIFWRDGRAAYRTRLSFGQILTGLVGSNPTLSTVEVGKEWGLRTRSPTNRLLMYLIQIA